MTGRLKNIIEVDFGDDNEVLTVECKREQNTDLRDVAESVMKSDDMTEKAEHIDLDEWEKDMEVKDRFQLWGWALRRKAALQRRHAVINVATELKLRFKKVLYLY